MRSQVDALDWSCKASKCPRIRIVKHVAKQYAFMVENREDLFR